MSSTTRLSEDEKNAANALMYFDAPIATLLESIEDFASDHIFIHDVAQAYSIFCLQIKAIAKSIYNNTHEIPALHLIKQHAGSIVQCLRRDIRRSLVDPFPELRRSGNSIPDSVALSTQEVSEEEMKYAVDLSIVCHYALQLLSDIFKFPVLSSLFSAINMEDLLDDVLAIALAPSLPTPNDKKTYALVLWTISVMQLPAPSLAPRKDQLKAILREQIDSAVAETSVSDSLKAVHNLLKLHPSVLLDPFVDILPSVLQSLLSPSAAIRTQAANALSSYVCALLSCETSDDRHAWKIATQHICNFTSKQSPSKRSERELRPNPRLVDVISNAIKQRQPWLPGQGPTWAMVVLACIIVLSDSVLFTHPPSLKLVISSLEHAGKANRPLAYALQPSVWKCLVWAFARMTRRDESVRSDGVAKAHGPSNIRHRAYLIIKQEIRGGIGTALVACVLRSAVTSSPERATSNDVDLPRALSVLQEMVQAAFEPIHSEGRSILSKLVNSIGTPTISSITPTTTTTEQLEDGILVKELFDGTILRADMKQLEHLVTDIGQTRVEEVRQLTEVEIIDHWEQLLGLWVSCVQRALIDQQPPFSLPADLLHIWQALLLVQAQLSQEMQHLTMLSDYAHQIVTVITDFLSWKPSSGGEDVQSSTLALTKQLWKVMENIFTVSWLMPVAKSILIAVLKEEYDLHHEDVKQAWSGLCATLISASTSEFLAGLVVRNSYQSEMYLRRYLWSVLAETWKSIEPIPAWQDTVTLLVLPFQFWVLSDKEMAIWNDLLDFAITCPGSVSISPLIVIETLVLHMVETLQRLSSSPQVTLILLSYFHLDEKAVIPEKLLFHINKFLCDLYTSRSEHLYLALEALRLLTNAINGCAKSHLVSLISSLSNGLCIWIHDESKLLLEQEYNDIIMTLYCDTLNRLRDSSFTSDTLTVLAPFFASAFFRIPAPALGPMAFKEFWAAVSPGLGSLNASLPEDLKECLKACHRVFGGVLPFDISCELELQSQLQLPLQSSSFGLASSSFVNNYAGCFTDPHIQKPIDSAHGTSYRHNEHTSLSQLRTSSGDGTSIPSDFHSTQWSSPQHSPSFLVSSSQPLHAQSNILDVTSHPEFRSQGSPIGLGGKICSGQNTSSPEVPFIALKIDTKRTSPEARVASPPLLNEPQCDSPSLDLSSILATTSPATTEDSRPFKRRRLEPALVGNTQFEGKARAPPSVGSIHVGGRFPIISGITTGALISEEHGGSSGGPSGRLRVPKSHKWLLDCVEAPTYKELKCRRSKAKPSTPCPIPTELSLSAGAISCPGTNSSQGDARHWISSYDYETWKAGLDAAEMQQIQDLEQHMSRREPASSQSAELELIAPSVQRAETGRSQSEPSFADTLPPSSLHDDNNNKGFLTSSLLLKRSPTAPASSRPTEPRLYAPPLRRLRTASAHVHMLQQAYDAFHEQGSKMPVDDMLAATKLVHEIDGVLKEHLMKRLSEEDGEVGETANRAGND
ncbi:hypothetical protein AcW1_007609 [Taiwanofungus camphoratus]|nr:hypothetical protein AcW2_007332 [Antrodia cinnamomea]KAI0947368.1 hypothetical protein AcV7_009812 [Antrodia cinnamomea]KAI0953375.1 hypothetical protein AcW1_007609 [Antrodia cinnamomea]